MQSSTEESLTMGLLQAWERVLSLYRKHAAYIRTTRDEIADLWIDVGGES